MKAILISIKPKYVAKILNGEKTIEIRKTMPKCDFPINVYIYCTKQNAKYYIENKIYNSMINGKVVAKFTLNKVENIEYLADDYCTETYRQKELTRRCCLTDMELHNYLKHKIGYSWHISNLVIFDKPRELSEFNKIGWEEWCAEHPPILSLFQPKKCYEELKQFEITKAPQSYQFIEVKE